MKKTIQAPSSISFKEFQVSIQTIRIEKRGPHIAMAACDVVKSTILPIKKGNMYARIEANIEDGELHLWTDEYKRGKPDIIITGAIYHDYPPTHTSTDSC